MKAAQKTIRLGTHGEQYGNWMPVSMLVMVGGLLALAGAFAALCFAAFRLNVPGVLFTLITLALAAVFCWIAWIRRQFAFGGGGVMERVHQAILSYLDFDGKGQILDVGCGSGALSIRAALVWPQARVLGIDAWPPAYNYSQRMCEKNAESEGVAVRCRFQRGDANKLDFPGEYFDAVVSNYVYHNITGADKQALLLETLRTLKKGGVFALNDEMKPRMYGDMEAFAQKLRAMGYEEVRLVDTAREIFGHRRAALMMLGASRLLVGAQVGEMTLWILFRHAPCFLGRGASGSKPKNFRHFLLTTGRPRLIITLLHNSVIWRTPWKRDHPATMERIQQAALEEFSEKGFLGASLRQIVKNAGVTTGAFYGLFFQQGGAVCLPGGTPCRRAHGQVHGSPDQLCRSGRGRTAEAHGRSLR